MPSLRENILQDLRGWADYVLSISQDKILKAYDHDPAAGKMQVPFLTMQIPSHANAIGQDELSRREEPQGNPQFRVWGHRWSMLQVDGYGKDATQLVNELRRSQMRPDVRRWLKNNGPLGIQKQSDVIDQTEALSGSYERRVTTDFRVTYRFATEWFDAESGIAEKLQLRDKSELKSFKTQSLANALDLDMTVGG